MNRISLALVAGFLLAIPSGAQVANQQNKEIQLTRQAIQSERHALVTQAMDLAEEEAAAFWPVYRDWRAKIEGITDNEVKLITDFAEKYEDLTEDDAKAIIDDWVRLEDEYAKLRKQYLKQFRKVLPEKKVMRFFQLENKMDAVVEYELAGSIPLAQ